jgi:hypothetical protein
VGVVDGTVAVAEAAEVVEAVNCQYNAVAAVPGLVVVDIAGRDCMLDRAAY